MAEGVYKSKEGYVFLKYDTLNKNTTQSPPILPHTGGNGRIEFFIISGLLIALSGTMYMFKQKYRKNEVD